MDDQTLLAAAPLVVLSSLLFLFALIDLIGRPASQVVGRKLLWGFVLLIVTVGPIAYLWFGRKRGAPSR
jgi:hypothetical protein